jgi:hypothetical protein
VGSWYTIGVTLGGSVGLGVILAGLFGASTKGLLAALAVGVAITVPFVLNFETAAAVANVIGIVVGVLSGYVVVQGALRRGGTRLGVAGFMATGGLLLMLAAAIPVVGYAIAVAVPVYAGRIRTRQPKRFAGLRTLDR